MTLLRLRLRSLGKRSRREGRRRYLSRISMTSALWMSGLLRQGMQHLQGNTDHPRCIEQPAT